MAKKDFEPIPPDWKGFQKKPVLTLLPTGGVLKKNRPLAKDSIRELQLAEFASAAPGQSVDIELIKDGQNVKQICFRCACGREAVVEIRLESPIPPMENQH